MAENGLTVQGKNIDIKEAENRLYSDDFYSKKKSGLLSGGKDLQKEVYSAINESMLMVRNEDPRAFQIGDMRYPTLQRLGMLGYFPEPGLEGVYPELLLIPTPIKGIGSGVTQGATKVLSTADKYTQGAVKFTTKHPVTAEMLVRGTDRR